MGLFVGTCRRGVCDSIHRRRKPRFPPARFLMGQTPLGTGATESVLLGGARAGRPARVMPFEKPSPRPRDMQARMLPHGEQAGPQCISGFGVCEKRRTRDQSGKTRSGGDAHHDRKSTSRAALRLTDEGARSRFASFRFSGRGYGHHRLPISDFENRGKPVRSALTTCDKSHRGSSATARNKTAVENVVPAGGQ